MNKISKITLIIYVLNVVVIIMLMLLGEKIPDFLTKFLFWGILIVIFSGIIENRKNNHLA